uniref:Uncharacterized protein n=1 Tax=Anguilla anguilla TaxID=7936 RepID=A0A0E9XSL2_ANGAN
MSLHCRAGLKCPSKPGVKLVMINLCKRSLSTFCPI